MLQLLAMCEALAKERAHIAKGLAFQVLGTRPEGPSLLARVEPMRGTRTAAIDEALEGSRAVWGKALEHIADVHFVDPDNGTLVLRYVRGAPPEVGKPIRLFAPDFITPLLDVLAVPEHWQRATALLGLGERQQIARLPMPAPFRALRRRQGDAVAAAFHARTLLVGPPGTGKTYTVGATAAYVLTRAPTARLLLLAPTNVAVDTALLAIDDWLASLARPEVAATMKRVGTRLDGRKFRDRGHLLASGVAKAAQALAALELEEPQRGDTAAFAQWKRRVEAARAQLRADVGAVASEARLVATTTAFAFIHYATLVDCGKWDFVVVDEASQVTLPAAVAAGALGTRAMFAGDPGQLAPVVQCPDGDVQELLSRTAFDLKGGPTRVVLDEQSRMAPEVCRVVSAAFYAGRLGVCRKAAADPGWRRLREPWFIDGRPLAHVQFEPVDGGPVWSQKYSGLVRFASAKLVVELAERLLGSGADVADIMVLTPFRAQRALIRSLCRSREALRRLKISTVHKAQGSQARIVVFDPVQGQSTFMMGATGRRLVNVALSRAEVHAVVLASQADLANAWLSAVHRLATAPPATPSHDAGRERAP